MTRSQPNIGIVYLARSTDGSVKDFIKFAETYNKYSAGIKHDLIIVFKGEAQRAGAKIGTRLMFPGQNVIGIDFSDADGFDIHAYLHVAKVVGHDYLCFLNTYSTICADDWLAKLMEPHLADPLCGVTGASSSYESLYTSYYMMCTAIAMASQQKIPFDRHLAAILKDELTMHAPQWMAQAETASSSLHTAVFPEEALEAGRQHWLGATLSAGPLGGYNLFKPFPNPHIRSNAWVINRELLNGLGVVLGDGKIDCCQFESGIAGLPTRLAERGLKQILVGANGQAYDVERWTESNCFRLGNQENILVRDNQVAVYDNASENKRAHLAMLSWGEYLKPTPMVLQNLGVRFPRQTLGLAHTNWARPKSADDIRISIVIPTRNRRSLVMEALHTIVRQAYPNWECIVFDNSSDEPVEELVQTLKEPRVKVVRSDSFLPVTQSWNRAIDLASGDYVTLIGDDDGLAPLYMNSIAHIARHLRPDFIYSGLFQFFHPGVAPWEPSGYVSDLRYGQFFRGEPDYFRLDPARAQEAVAGSLGFRRNFTYNMQAFCFERNFLNSLRQDGLVYHSPYPDYYLANIAFGLGKQIVIAPKPISIAGVSRKSFGFTLFNKLEQNGAAMLATKMEQDALYHTVADQMLPGADYVNSYFLTMAHVEARLGNLSPAKTAIDRYRRLQILAHVFPAGPANELEPLAPEFKKRLTAAELDWVSKLNALAQKAVTDTLAQSELVKIHNQCQMYGEPALERRLDTGSFADLPSLYDAMVKGAIAAIV